MAQILGKKGGHKSGGGGHFTLDILLAKDDKWYEVVQKILTEKDKKIIEQGSKNKKA